MHLTFSASLNLSCNSYKATKFHEIPLFLSFLIIIWQTFARIFEPQGSLVRVCLSYREMVLLTALDVWTESDLHIRYNSRFFVQVGHRLSMACFSEYCIVTSCSWSSFDKHLPAFLNLKGHWFEFVSVTEKWSFLLHLTYEQNQICTLDTIQDVFV